MHDPLGMLNLIGGLVAFVALIGPGLWLLRWLTMGQRLGSKNLIRVLETRSIAPGQTLYLLRVGEQDLLVGSSKAGLALISPVERLEVPEQALEDSSLIFKPPKGIRTLGRSLTQRFSTCHSATTDVGLVSTERED